MRARTRRPTPPRPRELAGVPAVPPQPRQLVRVGPLRGRRAPVADHGRPARLAPAGAQRRRLHGEPHGAGAAGPLPAPLSA